MGEGADTIYKGELKNGYYNGKGFLKLSNGMTYNGQFMDNVFHGQGRLVLSNGKIFEGEFINNKFKGKKIIRNEEPEEVIEAA